jgi:hypothetical protein
MNQADQAANRAATARSPSAEPPNPSASRVYDELENDLNGGAINRYWQKPAKRHRMSSSK